MIVHLRGTNGAGKSTIVRTIMSEYRDRVTMSTPGRRRPIGYLCSNPDDTNTLFIPGHYEIANGGIDTLRDLDEAYSMMWDAYDAGHDVLYEGKNMQDGTVTARAIKLFATDQIAFVHVNHPVDACIQAVRDRGHSIAEKTIRSIATRIERVSEELKSRGYRVFSCSREEALIVTLKLLRGEET